MQKKKLQLGLHMGFVATLALGSRPRQGLQGCGPRGKPGVAQHTPGSVKRCEGMNSHIPKEFHFGS
jgi:hypothetical protein